MSRSAGRPASTAARAASHDALGIVEGLERERRRRSARRTAPRAAPTRPLVNRDGDCPSSAHVVEADARRRARAPSPRRSRRRGRRAGCEARSSRSGSRARGGSRGPSSAPWSPPSAGILPDRRSPMLRPVLERLQRLDRRLLRGMRTRCHAPEVEDAVKALGTAGEWGAVWVAIGLGAAAVDATAAPALAARRRRRARRRRGQLRWSSSRCAGGARCSRRLPPLASAPSELSFPSAHATSSLAAATAMGRVAPGARPPLYGLAAAICLTRPYLGMHYPSDVLGGAALGLLIGRLWPGLRGKGAEDRLIDLAVDATRAPGDRPAAGNGGAQRPSVGGRRGGEPGAREGRHRRPAQRRQDDALQRADPGRRPRPPTTRSRRSSPTSPSSTSPTSAWRRWRRRSARARGGPGDDRVPRHRRPGARRLGGRGARQPLPRRDPRDRRDLPRRPRPRRRAASPIPTGASTRSPTPRWSRPSCCSPTSSRRERRLERVTQAGAAPATRRRSPSATGSQRVVEALGRGRAGARRCRPRTPPPTRRRELQALTSKPVLYVANVDEGDGERAAELVARTPRQRRRRDRGQRPDRGGAGRARRRARRPRCAPSSGSRSRGSSAWSRAAYELLDLITFFTAQRGSEARARALRRGLTAWDAAGQGPHRHPGRVRARRGDRLARAGRRRRLRRRPASAACSAPRAATTSSPTAT